MWRLIVQIKRAPLSAYDNFFSFCIYLAYHKYKPIPIEKNFKKIKTHISVALKCS